MRCPSCGNTCAESSRYCSFCGVRIPTPQQPQPRQPAVRSNRGVWPFALLAVLLLLLGGALYVLRNGAVEDSSSASLHNDSNRVSTERPALKPDGDEIPENWREGVTIESVEEQEAPPLSLRQVGETVVPSVVVLELRDANGKPLREMRGVVVGAGGVVLCRFSPLLGAYSATARFLSRKSESVDVVGLVGSDDDSNQALVRLAGQSRDDPWVEILSLSLEMIETPADVVAFGGAATPIRASLERVERSAIDRVPRGIVSSSGASLDDAFAVVDRNATLIGLCGRVAKSEDGGAVDGVAVPDQPNVRVDSAAALARLADFPVSMTLQQLTDRVYAGTFSDLFERGKEAIRQKKWADAVSLMVRALERRFVDAPDASTIEEAERLLRTSYGEEIARLARLAMWEDLLAVADAALVRYDDAPGLWQAYGEACLHLSQFDEAIAALLQARQLRPSATLEQLVEHAYLLSAREAIAVSDVRLAELALIEAIEQLPNSAALQVELARLYVDLEAFDDAVLLLQQARALDSGVADAVDTLLRRIDDALRRRDAVVIPIAPGSSTLRAGVVVDGRRDEFSFIIDTGATYTAIPWQLAEQLGYDLRRAERVNVRTAGGVISTPLIQMRSVSLQGYSVRNLRVLVLPASVGADTALLGLNFLQHFKYTIDAQRNEFRLERPERP